MLRPWLRLARHVAPIFRRRVPCCCCCLGVLLQIGLWLHLGGNKRSMFRRSPACLPLPPDPRNATQRTAASEPSFLLLWSTDASSFTLRARRCLESILYHHPRASVSVYSNELPLIFFGDFRRLGFDVRVLRYNVTRLLGNTPAAPWLDGLADWRRGPYYYSHVTDAIRLALLFREGGVYMDTDVVLTRPIRLAATSGGPAHGTAPSPESSRASMTPRPLHDALGIESYADPRTKQLTLNGAVMAFERGSRFLWNCLHEFAADYKADRWGWHGPELLTRVEARCAHAEGAQVQVEPPESFYPLHWEAVAQYADGAHPESDDAMWATIARRSYAVHVWNRKTASLRFAKGSLLHKLHNTWTVLPEHEECT